MQKLVFSITVDASRDKTWRAMLEDETYRIWTEAFMVGSHYVGDWSEGSEILFLGPGEGGRMSGMVSRIEENRPHEFVSIEHLGILENGRKDTTSDVARSFAGTHENYTFRDKDGGTEVVVEMEASDQYAPMFREQWPKALARLKALAEA